MSYARVGVAQMKRSRSPKLEARADIVSLHSTGPRSSPMQRALWACNDVARPLTVPGIESTSAWDSTEVASARPTPWAMAAGGSPTSADSVLMTSKGRPKRR
jgi:hypothetical protein